MSGGALTLADSQLEPYRATQGQKLAATVTEVLVITQGKHHERHWNSYHCREVQKARLSRSITC